MFSAVERTVKSTDGTNLSRPIIEQRALTLASYRANPTVSDIATISIGGNDIGFYDVLTACVLRVGGYWAGDCKIEIAKANEVLASAELSANITLALNEIINKNGNDDFKVYMTGYVTFFNETTPLCESSSFGLYNPHYDTTHQETDQPWLTTSLRTQLNDLVLALNTILSHVADSINAFFGKSAKVIFVDPNPAFAGHRWCENGVYEPDYNRLDTWRFLSGAPDNSLSEKPFSASESYDQEQSEQEAGPSFSLPDPTTCRNTIEQSSTIVRTDWYRKSYFPIPHHSIPEVLTRSRKYAVRYCYCFLEYLIVGAPSHTGRSHADSTG